jgi:hypothetical protein
VASSTVAHRGRDPRFAGNSNRSMTGTSRVSDSFLNPVINRGELRTVREVEIRGDVYVRMAGREDIARVAFALFNIDSDTIKFPAVREFKTENLCRGCFSCEAIRFPRMLRTADC